MKTCVVSFFDSCNLGDMLIANRLREFATEFGSVEAISYSGDPFSVPDLDALPLANPGLWGSPSLRARFAATGVGHSAWHFKEVRSSRHALIRATLERADLLVLGGGNMVFDLEEWTRSSRRFGHFVDTARGCATSTFGISLGIGPFASTRQHRAACAVLDRCSWLTFRDRGSLEMYLEHGHQAAEIGVDPVLLMGQVAERPASRLNRIAWNLVDPCLAGGGVDERERRKILNMHASIVKVLVKNGYAVELFSTDRGDDAFLGELAALVRSPMCRVWPIAGLRSLLEFYLTVDVVVASRMHALIVAFTQGAPIVGLSWQNKVQGFFELVDRQRQYVSFRELDPVELLTLVHGALAHPGGFAIGERDRAHLQQLNGENRRVMSELSALYS